MASIQGIYIALFGRPADPDGLAYWNSQTKNGTDLTHLVGSMTKSAEYQDKYAGKSASDIVTSIYQSLFGHDPDVAGLDFFVSGLTKGTLTLDTIAINIFDGAKGSDATILTNKLVAANEFTSSLDTPAEIAAYRGATAAANGLTFLSKVTADPATVPSQADVDKAVSTVGSPSGGQNPGDTPTDNSGGTPVKPQLFKLAGDDSHDVNQSFDGAHLTWQQDRSPLGNLHIVVDPVNASNNVLAFTLNGDPDSNFFGYAGEKLYAKSGGPLSADIGSSVSYKFYIDPTWNAAGDSVAQRSGLWVQLQNSAHNLTDGGQYSIAEYMDKDAVALARGALDGSIPTNFTEGFRFWSSTSGWSQYVETDKTGWVDLKFDFGAGQTSWSIDGVSQYTDTAASLSQVSQIDSIIVNSRDNSNTTTFMYDDISLVGTSHSADFTT